MKITSYLFLLFIFCTNIVTAKSFKEREIIDKFSLHGGIVVKVVYQLFNPKKYDLTFCADAPERPCLINNKLPFFDIGEISNYMPTTLIKNIIISYQGLSYELETSDMYSMSYAPLPHTAFDGYCYDKKNCNFRALIDDYCVQWEILDGIAQRTLLSEQMDIFQFCQANPVPAKERKKSSQVKPHLQ